MRHSVSLTNRVCAFCRQQQLRRISTTRNAQATLAPREQTFQQHVLTSRPSARLSSACLSHASHISPATRQLSSTSAALAASSQPTGDPTTTTTTTSATGTEEGTEQSKAAVVPQTHYEFFPTALPDGPPPRGLFKVDVRALRREFLTLQAGAHPDRHPAHMKARAQATSARINEAFRTLESPLLRAQYILALRGRDVANDETAKVEDPELLMLVLETRELIEEAEEESDLEGLKAENEARARECEDRLATLFAADDLDAAAAEVVRLRYWVNVRESINNWEKGKPIVLEH
ncbi:Co-chaperone Hsc20 [Xylaria sp. CBS 124048]|nr:Co-chaperone Hsc20 [Xylaria sp. CBS 124048]